VGTQRRTASSRRQHSATAAQRVQQHPAPPPHLLQLLLLGFQLLGPLPGCLRLLLGFGCRCLRLLQLPSQLAHRRLGRVFRGGQLRGRRLLRRQPLPHVGRLRRLAVHLLLQLLLLGLQGGHLRAQLLQPTLLRQQLRGRPPSLGRRAIVGGAAARDGGAGSGRGGGAVAARAAGAAALGFCADVGLGDGDDAERAALHSRGDEGEAGR
jgi:hypothetical protein